MGGNNSDFILFVMLLLGGGALMAGFAYLAFYLVTLPAKRDERARLFLDLLEVGMREGKTAEETILDLAETRDETLGVRFHLVAAHLQSGTPLISAIQAAWHMLPPRIVATLKVGVETGSVRNVLPVCKQMIGDGHSGMRAGLHYFVLLAFVVTPVVPVVLWMWNVSIAPRIHAVFQDMTEEGFPVEHLQIMSILWRLNEVYVVAAALVYLGMIAYVGGPRLSQWIQDGLRVRFIDAMALRIPWRWKRACRDFGKTFGLLLDADVPEERALQLAGESVGNRTFARRVTRCVEDLKQGRKLPVALRRLDKKGELAWRLENARAGSAGFSDGLKGWLDWLDATAFQQQQSAAQFVTTLFVLVNGVVVGLIAYSFFLLLTHLISRAVLW